MVHQSLPRAESHFWGCQSQADSRGVFLCASCLNSKKDPPLPLSLSIYIYIILPHTHRLATIPHTQMHAHTHCSCLHQTPIIHMHVRNKNKKTQMCFACLFTNNTVTYIPLIEHNNSQLQKSSVSNWLIVPVKCVVITALGSETKMHPLYNREVKERYTLDKHRIKRENQNEKDAKQRPYYELHNRYSRSSKYCQSGMSKSTNLQKSSKNASHAVSLVIC